VRPKLGTSESETYEPETSFIHVISFTTQRGDASPVKRT